MSRLTERQRDAEIERLTDHYHDFLMLQGEEYDPLEPENFAEAITEVIGQHGNTLLEDLATMIREGNHQQVTDRLKQASTEYWIPQAKAEAERSAILQIEENES